MVRACALITTVVVSKLVCMYYHLIWVRIIKSMRPAKRMANDQTVVEQIQESVLWWTSHYKSVCSPIENILTPRQEPAELRWPG